MTSKSKTLKTKAVIDAKKKPKALPVKTVKQAAKTAKVVEKVAKQQEQAGNTVTAEILGKTAANLKKVAANKAKSVAKKTVTTTKVATTVSRPIPSTIKERSKLVPVTAAAPKVASIQKYKPVAGFTAPKVERPVSAGSATSFTSVSTPPKAVPVIGSASPEIKKNRISLAEMIAKMDRNH